MDHIRFGLVWDGTGSPVEAARRAEDTGYDSLLFPDHTGMVAPLPAMAAAAAVTSRLRLGTQVINPAFRPLGALAQELAAVDVISGGRLEVGLGAGYAAEEVTSLGLPPGERRSFSWPASPRGPAATTTPTSPLPGWPTGSPTSESTPATGSPKSNSASWCSRPASSPIPAERCRHCDRSAPAH